MATLQSAPLTNCPVLGTASVLTACPGLFRSICWLVSAALPTIPGRSAGVWVASFLVLHLHRFICTPEESCVGIAGERTEAEFTCAFIRVRAGRHSCLDSSPGKTLKPPERLSLEERGGQGTFSGQLNTLESLALV